MFNNTYTHNVLFSRVEQLVAWFLHVPLFNLYFFGPRIGSYGFWQGRELHDICAEMTGIPADHWRANRSTCESLIANRFEAYVVVITVLAYFILLRCLYSFTVFIIKFFFCRAQKKNEITYLRICANPDIDDPTSTRVLFLPHMRPQGLPNTIPVQRNSN